MAAPRPKIVRDFVSPRFPLKEVALFLLGALLAVPFWPRRVRLDFGWAWEELCEQIVVAIIVVLIVLCCPRHVGDAGGDQSSYKSLHPTPIWKKGSPGKARRRQREPDNENNKSPARQ